MRRRELSIKRKVMAVIMTTSLAVLVLTVAAFITCDLIFFRQGMVRSLSTLARAIGDNSIKAVAFKHRKDAHEILSSLRAEPQVSAAALYDANGEIFATYPDSATADLFPARPAAMGHRFEHRQLLIFEPVFQNNQRLGTLCLEANLSLFYARVKVYAVLSALIVLGSAILALVLSNRLQKRISDPILVLAGVARKVSEERDFSVRASRLTNDELGVLTNAFNQMLTRIQEQTVALQENEERLRLALNASRTGAWDWNLQRGKVTWDDYHMALFGLKPGQFDGKYEHFLDLVFPEDRDRVKEEVARALAQKTEFSSEFRVVWPDGSIHDMFARGKGFYDPEGNPIRMSGVSQDITERKRSEEARRRLATIVESTDDAIISKDLNGVIISWNQGAERLFGYPPEEVIGKPITMLIPPELVDEERRILERIRRGERIQRFETVRRRKDGSRLLISLTLSPIRDAQGRIIGASKIARDIGDIKQAHEALERQTKILREQAQMLDLANVMARDLNDRIILWNTGMEKMYGWLRTETLGRLSHEVLRTDFGRPLEEITATLLRDGEWEGELIHTRKDGKRLTVASQWVLHRDDHGRPAAILEVNSDITGRKEAEQQILNMNAELERRVEERTAELSAANHELEAFTYSVAHDLRAPLRHIDAFSRIVAEDFAGHLPPEGRRYLDIIRHGSQNMSRLVDDLLNLARVGRQELKRQALPLRPLVEEVIADLKRESEGRQIEWRVARLPVVDGDPGLLKQVFANLLANAVKYTRPREKAVIEIGQRQESGDTVFYVRDNGVGFNMKYADKLFGVFQRLHRAEEFEGTGVGLAVVERVVRRHGGRIWAESEPDRGATFFFTLDGSH